MKKNLNKKGFTLIELLAVIVVLAIVMAIATQQVSRIIAKSRAEAMLKTMELAKGAVKNKITLSENPSLCGGNVDKDGVQYNDPCLADVLDYDPKNYEITITETKSDTVSSENYNVIGTDPNYVIKIVANDKGDFALANFNFVKTYKDFRTTTSKGEKQNVINHPQGVVDAEKTYVLIDKKFTKSSDTKLPTIICFIDSETGDVEYLKYDSENSNASSTSSNIDAILGITKQAE